MQSREKLDTLLEQVSSRELCRCHISFAVNLRWVESMRGRDFVLTGGETIPISRANLQASKTAFFRYLRDTHKKVLILVNGYNKCHDAGVMAFQRVKKVYVIPRERSDRGNPFLKNKQLFASPGKNRNILEKGLQASVRTGLQ